MGYFSRSGTLCCVHTYFMLLEYILMCYVMWELVCVGVWVCALCVGCVCEICSHVNCYRAVSEWKSAQDETATR